jgi:hypothetical protein
VNIGGHFRLKILILDELVGGLNNPCLAAPLHDFLANSFSDMT